MSKELKALTFGHKVHGRDLDAGDTYVDTVASDGSVRTTGDYGVDSATASYLKDGLICYRWNDWGSAYGSIFRKPDASGLVATGWTRRAIRRAPISAPSAAAPAP